MAPCDPLSINGIQEVSGSIPLISTKRNSHRKVAVFFWCGRGLKPLTSWFNKRRRRRAAPSPRRGFDPAYLHQTHYERLDFFGDQAFLFPQKWILGWCWQLPPPFKQPPSYWKGRFHVQKIVKAAFFCCPEMCLTVRQVSTIHLFCFTNNIH